MKEKKGRIRIQKSGRIMESISIDLPIGITEKIQIFCKKNTMKKITFFSQAIKFYLSAVETQAEKK